MSDMTNINPINNENSAGRSANFPALFSENPTSNDAEGGTMNTTADAPIATISEKELWTIFVNSETRLMTALGMSADRFRPEDLLRDAGNHLTTPDYSDEVADTIMEADEPEETLNAMIEDYGTYLRNLTAVRDTFALMKSDQFVYSDGTYVLYRKPEEGEAA